MTLRHLLRRCAAATLVVVAAPVVALTAGLSTPASAATCSSGSGVSVVVDFGQLGGGVQSGCVSGGAGKAASSLFPQAGFDLGYVQNQPGFVCRVEGAPSSDPCVNTPPATAYWGLWWSDGTSGQWNYSNYGVGSLQVPDGAYVALAWKQGSGQASAPGLSPVAHASSPSPTPSTAAPTKGPTRGPTHGPTRTPSTAPTRSPSTAPTTGPTTGSSVTPTTTALPDSASPTAASPTAGSDPTAGGQGGKGGKGGSASPDATPSASALAPTTTPTDPTASTTDPATTAATEPVSSGTSATEGLPVWVVPVVLLALAAAGVGVVTARRRAR